MVHVKKKDSMKFPTGPNASVVYDYVFGMLDMNSIGVRAMLRGLDSKRSSFHPFRAFKSNVHLWTVLKG